MEPSRINVGPAELEVRRFGRGQPLLLLHGEDGLLFCQAFVEALASRFEVIAPMHPGWGGSSRPPFMTTVRDLAEAHQEHLALLSRHMPVVGLSLGGWIGAELAIAAGPAVTALVLVAPLGIRVGARDARNFVDLYAVGEAERARALYADPAHAPKLSAASSDEDFLELAKAQEAVVRYAWEPYFHDPKLIHRLRRIAVPTLLVSGAADRFVLVPEYYDRYAEAVGATGAARATLATAGHRIEEEAPDALADCIATFIAGAHKR